MKKFCSSTYKAFESIFTNSLLQVFFAKMKYSLTNSKFQRAFGRYFRRKNHFSTNHTWELEECQMIFLKIKKEAPTFIVSAYHMSLLILKNSCGKSTGVLVIFFIPFSSFLRLTIRWLLLLKQSAQSYTLTSLLYHLSAVNRLMLGYSCWFIFLCAVTIISARLSGLFHIFICNGIIWKWLVWNVSVWLSASYLESPNCKNYPASSRNTLLMTVWIMPKFRKTLEPFIWWPPIFHTPKHILKRLSKYMKRSGLMSLKWLKQNIGRFRSYIHRLDFPLEKLYPVF